MSSLMQPATWRDNAEIRKPDGYNVGEHVWAEISGTWTAAEVTATAPHGVTVSYRTEDGVLTSTRIRARYVIHPNDLDGDV